MAPAVALALPAVALEVWLAQGHPSRCPARASTPRNWLWLVKRAMQIQEACQNLCSQAGPGCPRQRHGCLADCLLGDCRLRSLLRYQLKQWWWHRSWFQPRHRGTDSIDFSTRTLRQGSESSYHALQNEEIPLWTVIEADLGRFSLGTCGFPTNCQPTP